MLLENTFKANPDLDNNEQDEEAEVLQREQEHTEEEKQPSEQIDQPQSNGQEEKVEFAEV